MRNNEFKIAIILLALLITLGLLIGGQKLYNRNLIEKPVINELLKLNYVKSAVMTKEADTYNVKIQIKQPGNIKDEYNEINNLIKTRIKGKQYKIELLDSRNHILVDELQKMELGIYEAIAQNNYLDLEQSLNKMATQDHFVYRLQIDEKRLYLQIASGNHFLYEIFDRSEAAGGQTDNEE